jgi:hypothetical protein
MPTLPGIEPAKPPLLLTDDLKNQIKEALVDAFKKAS